MAKKVEEPETVTETTVTETLPLEKQIDALDAPPKKERKQRSPSDVSPTAIEAIEMVKKMIADHYKNPNQLAKALDQGYITITNVYKGDITRISSKVYDAIRSHYLELYEGIAPMVSKDTLDAVHARRTETADRKKHDHLNIVHEVGEDLLSKYIHMVKTVLIKDMQHLIDSTVADANGSKFKTAYSKDVHLFDKKYSELAEAIDGFRKLVE